MIIDSFIELRNGKINKLSLVDEPKFLEEDTCLSLIFSSTIFIASLQTWSDSKKAFEQLPR